MALAANPYAQLNTISKGGCDSELDRVNHCVPGAGMPWLRRVIVACVR